MADVAARPYRAPLGRFLLWLLPWFALLAFGILGVVLCLWHGLNQTNMDNRFAFGLWIVLDLTVIALGAGAFFSGLLLYILKRHELAPVIGGAVVLGFICYSSAVAVLGIDVGQPLRSWFTFWHPNVHSMLTEVTFCITCYLTVLAIEYVPLILKQRHLRRDPTLFVFQFQIHKVMPVFAGIGAFLSMFHQGSLGGLFGVLRGRPFAFREHFGIWPSTFFLFVLSAIATGPAFLALVTWTVSKLSRKELVKREVYDFLAQLSGGLLLFYVGWKAIDTLVWVNDTSPAAGFHAYHFYQQEPFGSWILFAEIVLGGLVPGLLFLWPRARKHMAVLIGAAVLACIGVAINRYVMTIQTLALPTLSVDRFLSYRPSWQEVSVFGAMLSYGVIVYSLSHRYLPLYPQEQELLAAQRGA